MAKDLTPLPNSTWRLTLADGNKVQITAAFALVNAGALVFKDTHASGNLIHALAPGQWLSAELMPA